MKDLSNYGKSKESDNSFYSVFMKGAPEMVEKFLSTIPSCYESLYKQYTLQGKRVISLAWKDLPESIRSSDVWNIAVYY